MVLERTDRPLRQAGFPVPLGFAHKSTAAPAEHLVTWGQGRFLFLLGHPVE